MNILKQLKTFKQVEPNLSTAIRIGHMFAQQAYTAEPNAAVENGVFFRMSKEHPDTLVLADDEQAVGPYLLHYTEELLTNGIVSSYKYFALTADEAGICYPRCLAIYAGDTYTTDNFTGELRTAKFAKVGTHGVLELAAEYPVGKVEGPIFQVVPSTLADGTPAAQCTVIAPEGQAA